jgi:hypothetical protein
MNDQQTVAIAMSAVLKEKVAGFEAKATELETERDILKSKLRNSEIPNIPTQARDRRPHCYL